MTIGSLERRVAKLERHSRFCEKIPSPKLFYVKGGYEGDDAAAFLNALGYDVQPNDIVIRFVGAKDGKPVEEPMIDVTPQHRHGEVRDRPSPDRS